MSFSRYPELHNRLITNKLPSRRFALIDSMYVQTMADEDMKGLSITEEEKSFSDAYVAVLNELKSQKH